MQVPWKSSIYHVRQPLHQRCQLDNEQLLKNRIALVVLPVQHLIELLYQKYLNHD
ncbi:hypothetical protein Lpp226_2711 [Lacticaseibacillus paracasei subsp. paracasei Lpp226]|nr:hypothetical protein Lpp226_2711 [Lacticaseibacillus paracasei subsp. paracasei Lpp226]